MKTEKAKIRLVLRQNKTLADGTHPIMLRISWNKERREKASGFSCKASAWSTTEECLKLRGRDALPNAVAINTTLFALKQKAEGICNVFIAKNQPYSATMIIEQLSSDNHSVSTDLAELTEEYIRINHLKLESAICLRSTIKLFLEYMDRRSIQMSEVTKNIAMGFGRWCEHRGLKNSTIRSRIQRMRTLYRYAEENDRVANNPFKAIKESKLYKTDNKKQSLTKEAYHLLQDFYRRELIDYMDKYSEEAYRKRCLVLGSRQFAYNVFFMSFEMQGLALIDMAKLTSGNIDQSRLSDATTPYCIINTKRSKTRHHVPIVIKMDAPRWFIFSQYFSHMEKNHFLLPILRKSDDTEEKIISRMRYTTSAVNRNLKEIWHDYNEWVYHLINNYEELQEVDKMIVYKHNLTPQTISKFLIDPQTSQYAARHTFATVFINSEGAKSTELAQMMGRSVTGMDRYIRDLMTIDDVLNAKDKMML